MVGAGSSLILPELGTRMELPTGNDALLSWGTGEESTFRVRVSALPVLCCEHEPRASALWSFFQGPWSLPLLNCENFAPAFRAFPMIAFAACFVPEMFYAFSCPYPPQSKDGPHTHSFICLPTEVEGMARVVLIGYAAQPRP